MIYGKKVVVVMPAYNAEKTLQQTYEEIDHSLIDEVILVDDHSKDSTKDVSKRLNLKTIVHEENLGYGGNQKTCYQTALESNADIVVMLHPDYQYSPKLVPSMAYLIASGTYDCVLGSRILGGTALKGGMPFYKYVSNRFLTLIQNWLLSEKVSEYHTGLRAFSKDILLKLPLGECDDDFIFDNQMLAQIFYHGFNVGEISCPTKYFPEASSINFKRSLKYGLGVLWVSITFFLAKRGWNSNSIFNIKGKKLENLAPRGRPFYV